MRTFLSSALLTATRSSSDQWMEAWRADNQALLAGATGTETEEVSRLHPGAKPDDADCAKAAVDEAMIRMREAIAAAGK
jgi:hypothetical protein